MIGSKKKNKLMIPFSKVLDFEKEIVGAKGANLGKLVSLRVPVPNGFVVSSYAYQQHLEAQNLTGFIKTELGEIDPTDSVRLENASKRIRNGILKIDIYPEIEKALKNQYSKLSGFTDSYVAVRSSAGLEDLKSDSFAGMSSTFLNIKGKQELTEKVKQCWASMYSPQNLFYAISRGYDVSTLRFAVIIQKMIQAEASGVIFTINPIDNDSSRISIEAVLGLGEALSSGELTPDNYLIEKETGEIIEKHIVPQEWMLVRKGRSKKEEDPNVKVKVGEVWKTRQKLENKYIEKLVKVGKALEDYFGEAQDIEWVYEGGKIWIVQSRPVRSVKVKDGSWKDTPTYQLLKNKTEKKEQVHSVIKNKRSLSDKKKKVKLDQKQPHISKNDKKRDENKKKKEKRKKIEKMKHRKKEFSESENSSQEYQLNKEKLLLTGEGVNDGIVSGNVKIIYDKEDLADIDSGTILVSEEITKDFDGVLQNVVGIVLDEISSDSSARLISKGLGIPCIVNSKYATKILREGEEITIIGGDGYVLQGGSSTGKNHAKEILEKRTKFPQPKKEKKEVKSKKVDSEKKESKKQVKKRLEIDTKRMQEKVQQKADSKEIQLKKEEIDSVDLSSFESINTATKLDLRIEDVEMFPGIAKADVDGVAEFLAENVIKDLGIHPFYALNDKKARDLYVESLASHLYKAAKSFKPRPIIYKLPDILSSEFRKFEQGENIEYAETNPIMGFRGANRYISDPEQVQLDFEAISHIRNKENLKNVWVSIPFVRSAEELKEMKHLISSFKLRRSNSFKIFVYADTPHSIVNLEEFIDMKIDGVIVNMKNIKDRFLVSDNSNPRLQGDYDGVYDSVWWAIERFIDICNKKEVTSVVTNLLLEHDSKSIKKLVKMGVSAITVLPIDAKRARDEIVEAERNLLNKK